MVLLVAAAPPSVARALTTVCNVLRSATAASTSSSALSQPRETPARSVACEDGEAPLTFLVSQNREQPKTVIMNEVEPRVVKTVKRMRKVMKKRVKIVKKMVKKVKKKVVEEKEDAEDEEEAALRADPAATGYHATSCQTDFARVAR